MSGKVLYTKPSITDLEIAYATDAVASGWGDRCYEYIVKFESAFSAFVGSRYVIATSSCTGALHMGLHALGVGRNDEVILANINWIATAAPIRHLGATPVLVDVLPETWCIDPQRVEAAITPQTKAIIATHLYGNVCNMEHLVAIGERHGVPVIEDAAEAIGSKWRGRHAGSIGTFGTFSFHGTKTITTGEGGMFVTNDSALFERVLTLSNHGRARGQTKQFWPDEVGFKYKMSNIQAAIGLAQMERIDELVAGKRRIFETYARLLHGLPLTLNPEPAGTTNGYWMPTIVLAEHIGVGSDDVLSTLRAAGIDARVFFHPLTLLGLFERRHPTPVADELPRLALNLPSYHDLTDDDQARVAWLIRSLLSEVAMGKKLDINASGPL